jgi:DNA-binding PadR family transcriptional regulator
MDQLTAFQRDILYVIGKQQDPHGLAIKTGLEAYYNTQVNHGRLYPNLDELVEEGLINKGEKDDRTNEYQLTDRARATIEQRREWESVDQIL